MWPYHIIRSLFMKQNLVLLLDCWCIYNYNSFIFTLAGFLPPVCSTLIKSISPNVFVAVSLRYPSFHSNCGILSGAGVVRRFLLKMNFSSKIENNLHLQMKTFTRSMMWLSGERAWLVIDGCCQSWVWTPSKAPIVSFARNISIIAQYLLVTGTNPRVLLVASTASY